MRKNDIRFVGADGRGYQLNCGENRGWRIGIPKSIVRWGEKSVNPCCMTSRDAMKIDSLERVYGVYREVFLSQYGPAGG